MADPETVVVTNPASARVLGRDELSAAMPGGVEWRRVDPPSADAARVVLDEAAERGARVVVVGGDGMVHLAVTALAGSDAALGIVPTGTGNDTARALGLLDRTLESQVATALGPTRDIDIGDVDGRPYASVATLGFAATVNDRANRLRWPRGSAAYTAATLLELPGLSPMRLVLDVDGEAHELEAVLVAVGNTGYFGGGMHVCPDADPADGRLSITVIGAVGRLKLLRTFPQVYSGAHVEDPDVRVLSARDVTIDAASARPVWADGEPLASTPAHIRCRPGALHVAAP